MLIESGLLTEERLRQSLSEARKNKQKLGQYLVRNGIVREPEIVETIAQQLKIDKFEPGLYPVDIDLAKLVPVDLAQKHRLAPIRKKGSLLTVAMTDPTDINALDAVEMASNCEVEPLVCTEQQLNELNGAIYGKYSNYDGMLEDIEELQYDVDSDEGGEAASAFEDVQVRSLQDMAEDAPVIRLVNSILAQAVREGASDVHIGPEKDHIQVRFRVDGRLHNVPAPPRAMFLPIVSRLKILGNMDIAISRVPQDGRFSIQMSNSEINVRVSTMPTIYGESLVLRLLDMSSGAFYSLDNMGLHPSDMVKVQTMIRKPHGLILASGPTGSGKSTTLYSILKKINQPDINIITLEDPVEFRVQGIRQIQLNRKAGMTFASGLRSILRHDPDVIMVGEIRDSETASIAVQAALTGHRVLSTVHTNDAAGATTRFMDMNIEPFLVASVMRVTIAQRLVRKICEHCREPYDPPPQALAFFGLDKEKGIEFMRGRGCFNCMDTGFKGRIGIFEVLMVDRQVQDLIVKRASSVEITRAMVQARRLRTLRVDAADKIRKGLTTVEEAASAVMG
ncbi:MAG: GspE/PulE family protein [Proteobacteria bacterium]|nr:GspE/PulE family protein [Pseudomonadota bacterium]